MSTEKEFEMLAAQRLENAQWEQVPEGQSFLEFANDAVEILTPEGAHTKILGRLAEVERQHNVRILFAAEAGSRAWGYANAVSDYDVHFIYVRRAEDYISIAKQGDVLDRNNGLEDLCCEQITLHGWDLLKAMELLRKSNASLLEMLKSPIVYTEDEDFTFSIQRIIEDNISLKRTRFHYLSMAKNAFAFNIEDRDLIKYKEYLYILRWLFSALWIEQYGSLPPVNMEDLLQDVQADFMAVEQVREIMENKAEYDQQEKVEPDAYLDAYIKGEIVRGFEAAQQVEGDDKMTALLLDPIIHRMVGLHG